MSLGHDQGANTGTGVCPFAPAKIWRMSGKLLILIGVPDGI
jgi:hypothetical protein